MRRGVLYTLALVVVALAALGLVVLSSAEGAHGVRLHGDPYYFLKRQLIFLGFGLGLAIAAAAFDYRRWRKNWILTVLFTIVVFILLWCVFGFRAINGSHRWIILGPARLQPGEFAKLAVVIATAVYLDKIAWRVELFKRGACVSVMIVALLALPVMLEPDFGSTMVIAAAGGLVMFISGVKFLHLLFFALCGGALVGYRVFTNANRMARILEFFGVSTDSVSGAVTVTEAAKAAAEYQAKMALVAIQRGGFWGVGLGDSMQKQLYLPEAHTDFIFAVGAEELGFFFSLAVIVLFFVLFALSVRIALAARDKLGRSMVMGMAFIIFFQAMFNVGVVCKALPTKGMALPFFSYGGTNLMSVFFAVGTILSVGIRALDEGPRPKRKIRRSRLLPLKDSRDDDDDDERRLSGGGSADLALAYEMEEE